MNDTQNIKSKELFDAVRNCLNAVGDLKVTSKNGDFVFLSNYDRRLLECITDRMRNDMELLHSYLRKLVYYKTEVLRPVSPVEDDLH
jgi:hypothetical protein